MIVFDSEWKAVERFKAHHDTVEVFCDEEHGPYIKTLPNGFVAVRTVFDLIDIKQVKEEYIVTYDKTLPILFKDNNMYIITIIGGLPIGKDTEEMISYERLFINHHIPIINEQQSTDEGAG